MGLTDNINKAAFPLDGLMFMSMLTKENHLLEHTNLLINFINYSVVNNTVINH